MKNTIEELVGHEKMRELPEESLEKDGGGVDLLALEGDGLSLVDLLYELLDSGGTG